MSDAALWDAALAALDERGWRARVVGAERLDHVRARVERALASADFPEAVAGEIAEETAFTLPEELPQPRSVIVAALARPLTQATLVWHGEERTVHVPPHYAGYYDVPDEVAKLVNAALEPAGCRAARCDPPLKTLAACAGLARYGRNNITYVPALGSYLQLACCVSDAPPPDDAPWGEPLALERCEQCNACLRACPTGAIGADRFPLHTERCLTLHNESREPFPNWIEPQWHSCAVGCLRCQRVCPENVGLHLATEPPQRFDAEETEAILAARDLADVSETTRAKLERCGLDYSPIIIGRNLRVLLGD